MRAGIVPCGAGIEKRCNAGQLGRLGVGGKARLHVIGAGLRRGQCLVGGAAGVLESLVDGGGIGIEHDGHGRGPLRFLIMVARRQSGNARFGPEERRSDYPIQRPVWPAGGGQGRDAALPPPYSPC
jgi:hypothetical protein